MRPTLRADSEHTHEGGTHHDDETRRRPSGRDRAARGCSDNADDGPLITASTYYEVMRVGDFADFTNESLDDIGVALCSDMRALDNDETRRAVVLVLDQQTDTELQSFTNALAITAGHCPEYFHLWDDEVKDIMGGELPW